MNKQIYTFVLTCSLFFMCKNGTKIGQEQSIPVDRSFLLGTWKNVTSQEPDFIIENDSIVFLQEEPRNKYLIDLTTDSLTIHFPSFNYTFKVNCYKGDSIHLVNEMSSSTFLKVK